MKRIIKSKGIILAVACIFAFALLLAGCSSAVQQTASGQIPAQANDGVPAVASQSAPSQAGTHYTISLDVNPSIELEVTDGLVTNVIAYNDDATALDLASLVVGLTPQEAVQVLVAALADGGYLAPELTPYLVITVSEEPDSPQIAEQLEQSALNALNTLQIECTVRSTVITQEVSEAAAGYGLSSGKYLILEYIAQSEGISLEEAIELYAGYRIANLLEQYSGAQDLFTNEEDAQAWREVQLQEAIALFEQEMHSVMDQFHAAFRLVKDTYKSGVQNLKDTYGNAGDPQYRSELKILKDGMLTGKQAALDAMKSGKDTAWNNLLSTALALGYSQEDVQAYLDMAEQYENEARAEANSLTAESGEELSTGGGQEDSEKQENPEDPGNSSNANNKDQEKADNPGKAVGKDKNNKKE